MMNNAAYVSIGDSNIRTLLSLLLVRESSFRIFLKSSA